MEWHWFYIFGIAWASISFLALLTPTQSIDTEIEQMWQDNF